MDARRKFLRGLKNLRQEGLDKEALWVGGGVSLVLTVALVLVVWTFNQPVPVEDIISEGADEESISEINEKVEPRGLTEIAEGYESSVVSNYDTTMVEGVPASAAEGSNCTLKYGNLMLINPNFTVSGSFIAQRRGELISLSSTYGIPEFNAYNGDNLLDATAAAHLNQMVRDYEAAYPGHTMGTMSCFRAVGTNCGRLCLATGTSEHHSGYTCDLIDTAYGSSLDTDTYGQHLEWQWLKANSYKYGFIDRYPQEWAGGSMSEPMNVNANGSTGLHETWHYRYVGVPAATEIATGKYSGGAYDSLEHYLLARGYVKNLVTAECE